MLAARSARSVGVDAQLFRTDRQSRSRRRFPDKHETRKRTKCACLALESNGEIRTKSDARRLSERIKPYAFSPFRIIEDDLIPASSPELRRQ